MSGTCACNRWASRDWGGRAWRGRGKEKGAVHDLGTRAIARETGGKLFYNLLISHENCPGVALKSCENITVFKKEEKIFPK